MNTEQTGAAVVEMAFVVLLLVWLVLGIVDIGRAIFTNITLQDAAQAGVTFAGFTSDANTGSVESAVIDSNDSLTFTAGDIDVSCTEVARTPQDASKVRVIARHSMPLITPVVGQAMGGTIDLERTAEGERFFESCDGLQEVPW